MKNVLRIVLPLSFIGMVLAFVGCQQPPTVNLNPDLTVDIVGPYSGNYVVNYEADPQNDFSSQINLVVSRIDNKIIRVDAQGGDSFECSIEGSLQNLTLSKITNKKGVYAIADELEGAFISGRLYYKVTGISNGGDFSAEFTAL